MAQKYFVDTNILIYAHDSSAGAKHDRARQLIERLWTSGEGVLSTQVLQELCINLRRKVARPIPVEEVRQLIQDYMSWEIVVNTAESVIRALESRCATRFRSGMLWFCTQPRARAPPFSIPRICQRGRVMVRSRS